MQLLKDLFRKKTVGGICLVILILFLFLAIFADVIAPTPMVNGTLPIDLTAARMPPFQSWEHPLGTDTMGQDLLSYMIYGARTSVILCVSCTVLSTLISVVIGVLSAVIGGWFDLVVPGSSLGGALVVPSPPQAARESIIAAARSRDTIFFMLVPP